MDGTGASEGAGTQGFGLPRVTMDQLRTSANDGAGEQGALDNNANDSTLASKTNGAAAGDSKKHSKSSTGGNANGSGSKKSATPALLSRAETR